jgi:hypothetical protein
MLGKVKEWKMTEEERLAYIAKYPIVKNEKPKEDTYANIHEMKRKKK